MRPGLVDFILPGLSAALFAGSVPGLSAALLIFLKIPH